MGGISLRRLRRVLIIFFVVIVNGLCLHHRIIIGLFLHNMESFGLNPFLGLVFLSQALIVQSVYGIVKHTIAKHDRRVKSEGIAEFTYATSWARLVLVAFLNFGSTS